MVQGIGSVDRSDSFTNTAQEMDHVSRRVRLGSNPSCTRAASSKVTQWQSGTLDPRGPGIYDYKRYLQR